MEKDKILEENLEWIIKIINLMGKAGRNEVYKFSVDDNPGYNIVFETKDGEGRDYHYFDYNLAVSSILDQKLLLQTKAIETLNGYETKIAITYFLENGNYRIVNYLNGWNHNNLIKLTKDEYLKDAHHITDGINDIKGNLPDIDNYKKGIFHDYQLKDIYDIINQTINKLIDSKEYNERLVNEVILSLTDEQLNVLKKTLKSGKY